MTRSQTPKLPNYDSLPAKLSTLRRRSVIPSVKTNLDSSKKNSKLNKSTGDLSKISSFTKNSTTITTKTTIGKLNGNFSKSTGNLLKLFDNLITPKVNGKLTTTTIKNGEKSIKLNGKFYKSLKSSQVDIFNDSLSQTPPTPPSSLLNSSWDDKKNFDIDYDSKLFALCDSELEDEIKSERWSDEIHCPEEEEENEFRNRSIPSDADVDSDFDNDVLNKSTKKRKSRSKRDSRRSLDISQTSSKNNSKTSKNNDNSKIKDTREKDIKDNKKNREKNSKEKIAREKDIKEKLKIKDIDKNKVKEKMKERKEKKENKETKESKEKSFKDSKEGKEKLKEKIQEKEIKYTKDIKENSKENNSKDLSVNNDFDDDFEKEIKWTKPINLFKGIKTERVCQICEQTGKLVRCKGPCYSYYHLKCVKPGDSSSEHSEHEDDNDNLEDEVFQDLKEIRKKIAEKESFTEKLEGTLFIDFFIFPLLNNISLFIQTFHSFITRAQIK